MALVEGVAVEDQAADRIRRNALLGNLVLCEAAAQFSDELKLEFAAVAWRQPGRLRNRIVHGYWSIDPDVVHATAKEQLPARRYLDPFGNNRAPAVPTWIDTHGYLNKPVDKKVRLSAAKGVEGAVVFVRSSAAAVLLAHSPLAR